MTIGDNYVVFSKAHADQLWPGPATNVKRAVYEMLSHGAPVLVILKEAPARGRQPRAAEFRHQLYDVQRFVNRRDAVHIDDVLDAQDDLAKGGRGRRRAAQPIEPPPRRVAELAAATINHAADTAARGSARGVKKEHKVRVGAAAKGRVRVVERDPSVCSMCGDPASTFIGPSEDPIAEFCPRHWAKFTKMSLKRRGVVLRKVAGGAYK